MTVTFSIIIFLVIIMVAYICLSSKPQQTTSIHVGENKVVRLSQKDDEIHITITDEEKERQDSLLEDLARSSAAMACTTEDVQIADNFWVEFFEADTNEKKLKYLEVLAQNGYPNIDTAIEQIKNGNSSSPIYSANNEVVSKGVYRDDIQEMEQ